MTIPSKEEIMRLIKSGFDLELLSFELDIPMEQLEEYSQELESYSKTIEKYKKEIAKNPQNASNKRNLLAFAYFKAGRMDEARDELMSLIDERSSYMAYRQLIHLEKVEGNFEDAKMWAYDFLDKFPTSTGVANVREQLMSIAREEGDTGEVIKQLREIIKISPQDEKSKKMLAEITRGEER